MICVEGCFMVSKPEGNWKRRSPDHLYHPTPSTGSQARGTSYPYLCMILLIRYHQQQFLSCYPRYSWQLQSLGWYLGYRSAPGGSPMWSPSAPANLKRADYYRYETVWEIFCYLFQRFLMDSNNVDNIWAGKNLHHKPEQLCLEDDENDVFKIHPNSMKVLMFKK